MNRYRFQFLLFTLLVTLLTMPFITRLGALSRYGTAFLFSWLLLAAVVSVSERKATGMVAIGLFAFSLMLEVVSLFYDKSMLLIIQHGVSMLFLGFVVSVLIKGLLHTKHVNVNTICAALSVYLLLAVVWAYAYSLVEIARPDSFVFNTQIQDVDSSMFTKSDGAVIPLYYSLVTLTTLGYGDIVPVSPIACMLAAVEAVIGQFYLTVLVAWLMGLFISESLKQRDIE